MCVTVVVMVQEGVGGKTAPCDRWLDSLDREMERYMDGDRG